MILIIGLGNPGKKFENTRHNVGFVIVESLKLKVKSFSDWKYEKKFQSEISEGKISDKKVILVKPQTFMNLSGKSVKLLNSKFKILNSKLFVVHDDLDLPLGKIRISKDRSSAGHKGVESIIRELGTKNFVRFRIGIKSKSKIKNQNAKLQFKIQNVEDFVLKNFTKKEEETIREVIKKTAEAIEFSLKEGLEKAMNKFNK